MERDIFVGLVGICVGVMLLTSALSNWGWYFQLGSARWLERRFGRSGARLVIGLLGGTILVIGMVTMAGFSNQGSGWSLRKATPGEDEQEPPPASQSALRPVGF